MLIDKGYVVLCTKNAEGKWEPAHPGKTRLMDAFRLDQVLTDMGLETKLFGDVAWEKYEEERLKDFWCPHGNHPDDYCEECEAEK
jgi:hypothetical protein